MAIEGMMATAHLDIVFVLWRCSALNSGLIFKYILPFIRDGRPYVPRRSSSMEHRAMRQSAMQNKELDVTAVRKR